VEYHHSTRRESHDDQDRRGFSPWCTTESPLGDGVTVNCSISSVEAEVGRDLCCGSPVRKRSGVGMGPVPWWFYFVPSWRSGNSENRIIARPDCIISLSTMRLKDVLASLRHDYVCIRKLSTSENSTRLRTKMFSAF